MEKQNKIPFHTKIFIFGLIGLLALFTLLFLFIVYFLGVKGFFTIMGVEYESIIAIFQFLIILFLISIFTDFINQFFKTIFSTVPFKENQKKLLIFLADFYFTWIAIYLADYYMKGIELGTFTEVIGAIILACTDLVFGDRKRKRRIIKINIRNQKKDK